MQIRDLCTGAFAKYLNNAHGCPGMATVAVDATAACQVVNSHQYYGYIMCTIARVSYESAPIVSFAVFHSDGSLERRSSRVRAGTGLPFQNDLSEPGNV